MPVPPPNMNLAGGLKACTFPSCDHWGLVFALFWAQWPSDILSPQVLPSGWESWKAVLFGNKKDEPSTPSSSGRELLGRGLESSGIFSLLSPGSRRPGTLQKLSLCSCSSRIRQSGNTGMIRDARGGFPSMWASRCAGLLSKNLLETNSFLKNEWIN